MGCLDELTLSSYLDKGLSETDRAKIEEHISGCRKCLDLLLVAEQARTRSKRPSPGLNKRIESMLGLKPKRKGKEMKWFLGAIVLFGLSFIIKRYFLQFLLASVILGFKWVMEGEGARQVIMIFKKNQDSEKKFERKSPSELSNITGGDRYDKDQRSGGQEDP
ncbi:MAG: zf-HC2 domain-containing protein [Candidatus Omnitrophota bacterium]